MQTAPNRHGESLRVAVASYVHEIAIPALDERAIAVRRGPLDIPQTPCLPLLRTAALGMVFAFAVVLAIDAPVVVAGVQRVFAAFTVVGGRTVPMSVSDVDLAKARNDVPFEIIVPPALPGITVTLREIRSANAPLSNSVAFDLNSRRPGPAVTIVESRDGSGSRQFYLSVREPDREDAKVAPLPALPKLRPGPQLSIVGRAGKNSFVPLTWITRGTRVVLMRPPGALSDAQIRAIRSAMSN